MDPRFVDLILSSGVPRLAPAWTPDRREDPTCVILPGPPPLASPPDPPSPRRRRCGGPISPGVGSARGNRRPAAATAGLAAGERTPRQNRGDYARAVTWPTALPAADSSCGG